MNNFVVTGASSGLGLELAKALRGMGKQVLGISNDLVQGLHLTVDLADPFQAGLAADSIEHLMPEVDVLVNCAGVNHIAYLEDTAVVDWNRVMGINALAPMLLVRELIPILSARKGTVLNVISNASHLPMTASICYNASKAALHIMTLQMARELTKRHGITVFGISPNKMFGTGMSAYIEERVPEVRGWTKEFAAQYQKQSLLSGEETDPKAVAEFIAWLLSEREHHRYLSGCVLNYGA